MQTKIRRAKADRLALRERRARAALDDEVRTRLKTQLDALDAILDTLQPKVAELEALLAALQAGQATAAAKLSELEGQVKGSPL